MKDYLRGARTSGLNGAGGASARCTPVVRVGHAALDAALAADRSDGPSLSALLRARMRGMDAHALCADAPAPACGRPADAMALTPNRHGRGPTLHVSTTHRVVDVRGRSRTIKVWRELRTFDRN